MTGRESFTMRVARRLGITTGAVEAVTTTTYPEIATPLQLAELRIEALTKQLTSADRHAKWLEDDWQKRMNNEQRAHVKRRELADRNNRYDVAMWRVLCMAQLGAFSIYLAESAFPGFLAGGARVAAIAGAIVITTVFFSSMTRTAAKFVKRAVYD